MSKMLQATGSVKQEGSLGRREVAVEEGRDGHGLEADAAEASCTFLVSSGSPMGMCSPQPNLVSLAPVPSPPPPLLQEAFTEK